MPLRISFIPILTSFALLLSPLNGKASAPLETTRTEPLSQPDPFEISVGYNYIYLGDAYPETEHLHGVDASLFYNLTPRIALGGDFMANFGNRSQGVFFGTVHLDSSRYIYVFGPRITLWQDPRFRLFAEILTGGVHAELEASLGSFSRTFSDDAFAAAIGGGLDWRFARHWSWRVIQADYLPTNFGDNWQHNFRASTGIVYSFGGRK